MIERLGAVDVAAVRAWISGIPFAAWPQQTAVKGERPAMVNDLAWCGFGVQTQAIVDAVGGACSNRMLSVVLPGHSIDEHADPVPDGWITRIHVPIQGDAGAVFTIEGAERHLEVGWAYTVDIRRVHSVRNAGPLPRIHLMWDVLG